MKRFVCVCLCAILLLGMPATVFAGAVIHYEDVEKTKNYVINWYNSGEYYAYGHCQGFVNQCWIRSLGGKWISTCCAKKGWDTFGVSASRDDIPIGAAVYFAGKSGKPCSSCGQYPGHVGFYIGNGEIIHVYNAVKDVNGKAVYMSDGSRAGYIKRTSIDYVINDGYTYLGWGWHSGKELETKPAHQHNFRFDAANERCSCGERYHPKKREINKDYKVIVQNSTIKSKPYSDYGKVLKTLKSGAKVRVLNAFENVYGNTWYEVEYNGVRGYMYSSKMKENVEREKSTLSIRMDSWPSSVKQGSGYGLRGTIRSNYSIVKVEGFVTNASGQNVLTSVDRPNSKSMDVKSANLNSKLTFNLLSAGNYKLTIIAYDNSGNTATATKNFSVYTEKKKVKSTLSVNLERYPVTLSQGSSFGLRGTVTSNYSVSEVRGSVINSAGNTVLSSKDRPNTTSMDIRYADLNNSLVFNKLGAGRYTMKVVAIDSSGRQVTATKQFTVPGGGQSSGNSGVTAAASTLAIGMTSYPASINQGSGYGLRGTISSNYTILKVRGYVIDSSGSTVMSSTDCPNAKSMDVRSSHLNNDLIFNHLGAGSYTLKVVATDAKCEKTWSAGFTVVGTQPTPSEYTKTGIVNIPSSWDNLSIRSGPSTNYKIVGSMNQGARCTVYPNKTQNGWYYVNYNGVTGYASGKQIQLQ